MPTSNPQSDLQTLVGEWDLQILHPDPDVSPDPIGGSSSFEWVLGGAFLVQRQTVDHPDFPESLAVVGPGAGDGFAYHYYDSRGVARTYQMRLDGGTWTFWREDPDFYQRFTWEFSPDGGGINAKLEMSHDQGRTWEHDFDQTLTRVTPHA